MEEAGRIRRGYFVEGLGAAQFAAPGALDRLRADREPVDDGTVMVLAAADPANPYGAAIPWPRRDDADRRPLARAAGAYVVLVGGEPVLLLERGGRSLQTLPAFDGPGRAERALQALGRLVDDGRYREIVIAKVDGIPIAGSPARDRLLAAGLVPAYRGLALRGGSVSRVTGTRG
jgi:ATP-dependent Lhr-like helicase